MNFLQMIWSALTVPNESLINILYIPFGIIEAIITMLLFTEILSIHATRKQKIIYVVVYSILGLINRYLIPVPYNVILTLILCPILVLIIFKSNFLKAILAEVIPIIILKILESFIMILILFIFGISFSDIAVIPIYRLSVFLFCFSLAFILYLLARKFRLNITLLDSMSRKTRTLLLWNSILMFATLLLQTNLTATYVDILPLSISFLGMLSLIGYYFISMYNLNNINQLQIKTQQLQQTEEYNKTLTSLYEKMNIFRHDYNNVIQAIGGYVATEDMEGFKNYYSQLSLDCRSANNLKVLDPSTINNPPAYSLISSKYQVAVARGIQCNLDIQSDLSNLNMPIYEFAKVLGILLDNSIEASEKSEEKIINITIEKKSNRHVITIENTYINKDVNTDDLFKKGISSKADKENHGIGLWEVGKIVRRSKNLDLFPSKTNMYFKQEFSIYNK